MISLLIPTLQNLFSPPNPKIPPNYRNSFISKGEILKIKMVNTHCENYSNTEGPLVMVPRSSFREIDFKDLVTWSHYDV